MLLTKNIEIELSGNTIKYYEDLGYIIPRSKNKQGKITTPRGIKIIIKVEDLPNHSKIKVDVKCDCCGEIINPHWYNYLRYIKEDGKYYCQKCVKKLYANKKAIKTRIKNGTSFEQWCIENNRQDVLDRWDYDLNNCLPSEISYGASSKKYYFKCPRDIHKSELKIINCFTNGQEGSIFCNACNSFAQWGIDNLGEDFLEKYWDYKKNKINPWEISKGNSTKKIYIKCQEQDYHGTYDIVPNHFILNYARCPYCNKNSGKVHPLDSLGKLLEDKGLLHLWSNKNKKTSWKYSLYSQQEVYWKCPEGIHEDYPRSIASSNRYNFRCPECQFSKGEERISNYFISNGLIKITEDDYNLLDELFKEKYNYYMPQKEFNGLVGLKKGNLSYDFYLPNYNLLIEYQGQQHEKYIPGFHKSKKDFLKQLEHDRRKKEYAKNNNINLLEIWYWDFDNIEDILYRELK